MTDLSVISHIWNTLVASNTFNFILFVVAFVWLFKKINISALINSMQEKIVKVIDEAKNNQKEAKDNLLNAETSVRGLSKDLEVIVKEAEKSAEVIGMKILHDAQVQVENIESNAKKVIEAEEKLLVSKLTKNTSLASVEAAKSNIKEALNVTPDLHERYINASIDELDRLNF